MNCMDVCECWGGWDGVGVLGWEKFTKTNLSQFYVCFILCVALRLNLLVDFLSYNDPAGKLVELLL